MPHSWGGAVAVPLTLLGLAALCQATSVHDYKCYKFQQSSIGTIDPDGDINLEVGSSYEAYCLFNPAEVQVEDVFFKTTENEGRRLDHIVVNNSAIKVQVTHNAPANYQLKCMAGKDFICRRTVFVGYKPQDVQNFTCVSKNWESLNCSWSVPENPVKVTYLLTYVIQDYSKDPSDCPQSERRQNWCFWQGMAFLSGRQNWTIIFSAENNLTQDPVEFKHHVDVYASVIPGKASNLRVDVLGPRKVSLKWNLPHPIDVFTYGKVIQEVKYRIKPFRNILQYSPWKVIDTWKYSPKQFDRMTFNKNISDLKPYVEYEFCVRLHTGTGPIREHMWSEPAIVANRTKSTRPMVAPVTTPGMFEVEENKLQRDVYVSWQTVDPLEENGPNFAYEVQMFDHSDGRRLRTPQSTERGFIKFWGLENTITYRMEIKPRNDNGLPEDPNVKSEVIVPKKASLLNVPDYFKVIAYSGNDTTTYMARWQIPEVTLSSTNIETVTLYWCKQTEYENRCQNKLSWEIVNDPAQRVKNLTGYDPSSRHMFGISVNTHNSSSGIKWSGCIATHGEQQPAIDEFNYTNVLSSEVKLKWDLECKAQAAQPVAFNISYCVVEKNAEKCAEPEKFIRVDGESTVQYTVTNLHAYRDYSFSIATISKDLGLGKWSRNVRVKTKATKPSAGPQNITVVSKGKTWIFLSWHPPPEPQQNGDIVMYKVEYKVKGSLSIPYIVEDNILQYNFTSLDPFTEYQFDIFPCTRVSNKTACGTHPGSIEVKTKIGAPGEIDSLQYDAPWLKWDHEDCNGPSCSYELQYTVNGTYFTYNTTINISAVSIRDLNVTCPVNQQYIPVKLRAVNTDEENHRLIGPQKDWKIPCPSQGLAIGAIVTIVFVCIIITLFILGIFTYGWEQVKTFMRNLKIKPNLPIGLAPQNQSPSKTKKKWYENMSLSKEAITTNSSSFKPSEKQDLIDSGNERQHRNFSGDSGTSVADPADSSGCSTGGDSVSSSGSDRIPPSSDSGTVQEETGFTSEDKKWTGSVRLRTNPPYVLQGLPDKVPSMKGYVSVGSVPNLAVSATDGVSSLQQSNPSLGLEPLQEVPMGGRRTSTGYISMPTNESDGMSFPLEDLGNLVLPHERPPGDFLAYSRHCTPYKKTSDFSPYSKAQSLPWLNTGYVAVSQAEDGGQTVPGAQGYVAVGDAMNLMKRQPSLPSLPMNISKQLTTPDQDLPPGAYCKLGAHGSPDPPPNSLGYVSATQHMPMPNALAMNPPVYKSPYVTCAMAESVVSPKKEPRKTTDYVALGDTPDGQWAHPIIHPMTPEETRDVLSAPVEGSRGRAIQPVRPNSSETNNTRRSNQLGLSGHSLSKQSSGYASGNVSQETLTFNDPLVMSPKKLLTRSYEPHSVVYSPHHKPSMV